MKIIYNKYIPFGSFLATNLFGIIFCRSDKGRLSEVDKNHEYIHTLQQREMLFLGFTLWYCIEWLWRYAKCRDGMKAYRDLYFEREAYTMESDLEYRHHRKHFAWWYLFVRDGSLLHETGEFLGDIGGFIKKDFLWVKYLSALALAVLIIIAQVKFSIYDIIIAPTYDDGTSMLRIPLIYIMVYFLVLIPSLAMHSELWRLRRWQVWVFPIILLTIDGAGQGYYGYMQWADEHGVTLKDRYYLRLVGSFMFRSVFIVLMLCVFRKLTEGRFGLFGLRRSTKYLRVYALIYVLLLPMFLYVSFTPQFLDYYPKMFIDYYDGALGWDRWQLTGLFELFYANDFIGVEGMFRGALVIGMSRWLGCRAVLPMALTYMCIHLGKPDLELCSSVIGGYILGVLAWRTHHLWGGIIIHLGIAMFFEAVGIARLIC
ncbi:MAG: CPBP family intramembrane metalloprotease [Prevotella sp.]|nr:CPBP family intramembrane metalloprotease [Prevotella sp.]